MGWYTWGMVILATVGLTAFGAGIVPGGWALRAAQRHTDHYCLLNWCDTYAEHGRWIVAWIFVLIVAISAAWIVGVPIVVGAGVASLVKHDSGSTDKSNINV